MVENNVGSGGELASKHAGLCSVAPEEFKNRMGRISCTKSRLAGLHEENNAMPVTSNNVEKMHAQSGYWLSASISSTLSLLEHESMDSGYAIAELEGKHFLMDDNIPSQSSRALKQLASISSGGHSRGDAHMNLRRTNNSTVCKPSSELMTSKCLEQEEVRGKLLP